MCQPEQEARCGLSQYGLVVPFIDTVVLMSTNNRSLPGTDLIACNISGTSLKENSIDFLYSSFRVPASCVQEDIETHGFVAFIPRLNFLACIPLQLDNKPNENLTHKTLAQQLRSR